MSTCLNTRVNTPLQASNSLRRGESWAWAKLHVATISPNLKVFQQCFPNALSLASPAHASSQCLLELFAPEDPFNEGHFCCRFLTTAAVAKRFFRSCTNDSYVPNNNDSSLSLSLSLSRERMKILQDSSHQKFKCDLMIFQMLLD